MRFFDKDIKLKLPFLIEAPDGSLQDLTGYTVKLLVGTPGAVAMTIKTLDVDPDQVANKGHASYLLQASDFASAVRTAQIQLSKTGEAIHTEFFRLDIGAAIRTA